MAHHVLVQGVFTGHQHQRRFLPGPAGPPAALPCGHHRTGIPHQNAQIEIPDVDAQFQGAGGYHRQQFAAGQLGFDLSAFLGKKPGTVGADSRGKGAGLGSRPHGHEFGELPRLGVNDGPQPPVQGRLEKVDGRGHRAGHRVDEDHVAPSPRGAAFRYGRGLQPGELGDQPRRIGHRGRTADKSGAGAVAPADALQAPKDLGHMGPHDPPAGVHLIDHHHFQAGEKPRPAFVVRQQGQMQHIGVGQKQRRRVGPNASPFPCSGISVVNGGAGRRV